MDAGWLEPVSRLCDADDAAQQSKDPKDRTWTCFFMSKTKIINALKCEIMIPLRSITKRREPCMDGWFFVATLHVYGILHLICMRFLGKETAQREII